ncbi:MAG TPA: Smr/MutS family protein [Pyrinomonadaceae bacterium]|nr:Smr/MutS family protein [Pyrinomonadaceae bacterium]
MKLPDLLRKFFGAGRDSARVAPAREEQGGGSEGDEGGDEVTDVDPFNPFPEPLRLEITDVFDLHTIRPREVRAVVEEYLREARHKGFRVVRIVHGKGVGVQREVVRSVLARTPFVERFADAPADAGGWGATVAFLKMSEDEKGK